MRLFMIRHGESENNQKKLFTGWVDCPLTEKGRKDAESIKPFMSSFKFDKVYSSDLCRAIQTAKIVFPNREPETSALIRERSLGTLENQPIVFTDPDIQEAFKTMDFTRFGGEDRQMLSERLEQFLATLEASDHNSVAVFTHGGILSRMLNLVNGEHDSSAVRRPNCAIAVFDYTNNKWMLTGWLDPALLIAAASYSLDKKDYFII